MGLFKGLGQYAKGVREAVNPNDIAGGMLLSGSLGVPAGGAVGYFGNQMQGRDPTEGMMQGMAGGAMGGFGGAAIGMGVIGPLLAPLVKGLMKRGLGEEEASQIAQQMLKTRDPRIQQLISESDNVVDLQRMRSGMDPYPPRKGSI